MHIHMYTYTHTHIYIYIYSCGVGGTGGVRNTLYARSSFRATAINVSRTQFAYTRYAAPEQNYRRTVPYEGENFADSKMDHFSLITS